MRREEGKEHVFGERQQSTRDGGGGSGRSPGMSLLGIQAEQGTLPLPAACPVIYIIYGAVFSTAACWRISAAKVGKVLKQFTYNKPMLL